MHQIEFVQRFLDELMLLNIMKKTLQLIILLTSILTFSQEKLIGKYCSLSAGMSDVTCIDFKKNKRFEYAVSGCLGISHIGAGIFELNNQTLKLTFDKNEQPTKSIITLKEVQSNSENIEFKFVIKDESGGLLPANLVEQPNVKVFEISEENNTFKTDKKKSKIKYEIIAVGFESAQLELEHNSSKLIEITMFPAQALIISEKIFEWNLTEINSTEFKTGPKIWNTYRKIEK
jgi:hypothetical protein